MAKQTINIGSAANDGTGSTLREAFDITNDNFTELYDGTGGLFHKIEGTNFTGSLLIGHSTTGTLSEAIKNTGVGLLALDALSSGDSNTAIGYNAGSNINSGSYNVLIGTQAGDALTSGTRNIAIGNNSLTNEDGHGRNVAIGHNTLFTLNAGTDAYNVAVGYDAGVSMTTGVENTLIGGQAGDAITEAKYNVAVGMNALGTDILGWKNTAIGNNALGTMNPASAADTYNVGVGHNAGINVTTGIQNTILGALAGDALTEGSNNIIIGYAAAASAVDVSNEVTIGNSSISNVRIPADSTLKIGASGDLQLEHLSSNSFIKNTAVGDLYIENQVDDKDVIFRSDDGSGGLATYFYLDGSGALTRFSKRLRMDDSINLQVGSSGDMSIYHNGTDTFIDNATGHLNIRNQQDDGDIIFTADDGSGGLATYFYLDGSASQIKFEVDVKLHDNDIFRVGSSDDLKIFHSGTESFIQADGTGNLTIEQKTDDADIVFKSDDGSGGTTEYFKLDGSLATGSRVYTVFPDNSTAVFGTGFDFQIHHDASNTYLQQGGTGDLYIQQNVDDRDIIFQSDDGSGGVTEYFRFDGSSVQGIVSKPFRFLDSVQAIFGTGNDLQIYHDGSNSYIQQSGTGDLYIQNGVDDKDIIFQSDDGSGGVETYFFLDGSASAGNPVTIFPDLSGLFFGTGADAMLRHDGTDMTFQNNAGDLIIQNLTNDKDIIFKSDDGSGGQTAYITLDGSEVSTVVNTIKVLMPNLPTSDPSVAGQLYNDSGVLKVSAG